ncbi:HIRAN domain-containing protein [Parvibaculum sp.]|uniref:HIRAN domain-containing protein n=1 Tax=Parvibaculum sp. TaxID=2024848 RepID=UPI00320F5BF6
MGFFVVIGLLALLAVWLWTRNPEVSSNASNSGPVAVNAIELLGDGSFSFEIVGEAFYQAAIELIAGGRTEEGVEVETPALLVPEPTNPHDHNAVAVQIFGHTVGYLSRPNAARYRAAHGLIPASCTALIVGGWDRGPEDQGHFGVKLDIDDVV